MRISHEAIYLSLYIQGGARLQELVWCLRTDAHFASAGVNGQLKLPVGGHENCP